MLVLCARLVREKVLGCVVMSLWIRVPLPTPEGPDIIMGWDLIRGILVGLEIGGGYVVL